MESSIPVPSLYILSEVYVIINFVLVTFAVTSPDAPNWIGNQSSPIYSDTIKALSKTFPSESVAPSGNVKLENVNVDPL